MPLSELLPAPLVLGEPDVAGALTVFPLLGGQPTLEYRSFAEASALGATVTELPGGASVNDVLVGNPLDVGVLLYEGELLVGAQQDRTVDHAVLVPARSKTTVPVSCVEHGRWDGSRHAEGFTAGTSTAPARLRAIKSRSMRASLAAGMPARADQHEVWQEVEELHDDLAVEKDTQALPDVLRARDTEIAAARAAIRRRDGQIGAIACVAGRPAVLDLVSRADVFAALHGALVGGYALDAAASLDAGGVAGADEARAFLGAALDGAVRRGPSAGVGESLAVLGVDAAGTGLAVDGELIQLCVYATDSAAASATRVVRPSRRR